MIYFVLSRAWESPWGIEFQTSGFRAETQEACPIWTSLWMSLTLESLLLNGRASERGIRRLLRSIPYGDSKFFLCFTLVTVRQKHVSLFLHRSQNLPSLLFNVNFIISTLRLFYLKAGAKLRGGEKPCNKVCCYIDGWLQSSRKLWVNAEASE